MQPRLRGMLNRVLDMGDAKYNFELGLSQIIRELQTKDHSNYKYVDSKYNWSPRPIIVRIVPPGLFLHYDDRHIVQFEIILDKYEYEDMFVPGLSRNYSFIPGVVPKEIFDFGNPKFLSDAMMVDFIGNLHKVYKYLVSSKNWTFRYKMLTDVPNDKGVPIPRARMVAALKWNYSPFRSMAIYMRRGYVRNISVSIQPRDHWFDSWPLSDDTGYITDTAGNAIKELQRKNFEIDPKALVKYQNRHVRKDDPKKSVFAKP